MTRGRGPGRIARLTKGADAIEIKATIASSQVAQALTHYALTQHDDEDRLIYFFDTPQLDLLAAGVIARARRVIGREHDSTIKFRPVEPDRIARKWRRYEGFKIEVDASEKRLVTSASFSWPVPRGLIKKVVAGSKGVRVLFSKAQESFLSDTAKRRVDYSTVVSMGPLRAQRWAFEDSGCPWPITAELWEREDGARLMEVSVKAPVAQAAAVMAGFLAFLIELGADREANPQAKTRWALEYYAARGR